MTASAPTPTEVVQAVRKLEHELAQARRGRSCAERRVHEAHRQAGELLSSAQAEAESAARRRHGEIVAAADEDAAALLRRTDAHADDLRALVRASLPELVATIRAVVVPRPAADQEP